MNESLLVAGIVCIVASIVGGGIKLLGAEVPILNSFPRQAILFVVGLAFLGGSYIANLPKTAQVTPKPSQSASSAPPVSSSPPRTLEPSSGPLSGAPAAIESTSAPGAAGCSPATGLACLPASSRPVIFANPGAANAAAWRDYRRGLSTTAGASLATNAGASGKAARLCGIVTSTDSSGLGKHLAALALHDHTATGSASADCVSAAASYQ